MPGGGGERRHVRLCEMASKSEPAVLDGVSSSLNHWILFTEELG